MPVINDMAIRLYRRLFGVPAGARISHSANAVLDGNSAVALTEASIASSGATGGGFPADGAGETWLRELDRRSENDFDDLLVAHECESPRGALAAAMGNAMAGLRATAFLSGQDLAGCQDLLANAAGRHLPLVIHLSNRALASQGNSSGSGHEALHQAAESGCFVLFANNVQEAVDLTLIARRVAEAALLPGIVAMDGDRTAIAPQEVILHQPELVGEFIGPADAQIASPTEAQRLLYGEQRRRVPGWHDPDQPLLQGSVQTPEAYALGRAGAGPYFETHLETLLEEAVSQFRRITDRHYGAISSYRNDDASLVLVAQGAAVETARAAADLLRSRFKLKTGVIGIRTVRPFPGSELVDALKGAEAVLVLERQESPLATDPPLLREIRAALYRSLENSRFGREAHPGYPRLDQHKQPLLHSIIYGTGGLPLVGGELVACVRSLKGEKLPVRRHMGVEYHNSSNTHPKRRVLLDQIRRAYPGIEARGSRTREPDVDLRAEGSLSLAIDRLPGSGSYGLCGDTAALLHSLNGGIVRTLPAVQPQDWNSWSRDLLHQCQEGHGDPGDETPLDLVVITAPEGLYLADPCHNLSRGGKLLINSTESGASLWRSLNTETRRMIAELEISVYQLSDAALPEGAEAQGPAVEGARLLGALFALLSTTELITQSTRRIRSGWETELSGLGERELSTLLAAFDAGMESLTPVAYAELEAPPESAATTWSDEAPRVVRQLGGNTETVESLPRFWDQVGILYRTGESHDLTADPFMAVNLVPPLSASFRDLGRQGVGRPSFSPEACTACGNCWHACPDSAIGVTAITPSALLDTGIRLAKADTLRPMASKLAARISALGRSSDLPGETAGEMLASAWQWLQEKAPLPEERLAPMQQGFQRMLEAIGELQLAVTDPLFHDGEKSKKDGGELLALVLNPDACKGCGLCSRLCESEALTTFGETRMPQEQARRLWNLWGEMPDTPSATIERVSAAGTLDPMSAVMMSRFCGQAMSGGDGAEAGSGAKIALRMVLAAAEYQQQPLLFQLAREIDENRQRVNELIRNTLADALPTDDLERLAQGLKASDHEALDIATLLGQSDQGPEGEDLDVQQLRTLVELAQGLNDAHWRLTEGPQGLGRARFGIAVAPGDQADWASAFPNNPFEAPVTLDMTGDTPQLAAGLVQGQIAATIHTLELLQRAKSLLDSRSKQTPGRLSWETLSGEERRLCPPMILVGDESELGGRCFSQVAWLLASGLPVKLLVMSQLDLGIRTRAPNPASRRSGKDPRTDLGLMALAQREAYAAQCSIAHPEHFRQTVREALSFDGPALLRVHTPSPAGHGFPSNRTLEQARLAVSSRAFPLFRYHPEQAGVFGSRLTLDGNPEPRADWAADDQEQTLNPVDWAKGERRFAAHIRVLTDEDPNPTEFQEWLKLNTEAREGKSAVLTRIVEDEAVRYWISPELMGGIEKGHQAWRTLQELAGEVTPFTERVNREAEERVAEEHRNQLEKLKQIHESELQALQEQIGTETAGKIRERLLVLAGYR